MLSLWIVVGTLLGLSSGYQGVPRLPTIQDPLAPHAQAICPGYTASNVKTSNTGMTATLQLAGPHCQAFGNDIDTLSFSMAYQADNRLNVKIEPANIPLNETSWYILPEYITPSPPTEPNSGNASLSNDMSFYWSNSPTFNFQVVRDSTKDVLFNTAGSKIVFEDQYIEFVTQMPADYNLYGLGENIHSFRLGNNFTKTMYNVDAADPIDGNMYGTHPVYVDTRYVEAGTNTSGVANYKAYSHGLYNRNAHAQEVLMNPQNVTWRALGGIIDLYFYSGPSATDVISAYHQSAAGLPAMQQYWTFGYHQCRWGYTSWDFDEEVVQNFTNANIPLETIWNDIDYMDKYLDFTTNPVNFSLTQGAEFLDYLHNRGQHYMLITDAGIYVPEANNDTQNYPAFTEGNATDSFVKNPDGSLYIGAVWPGNTAFPDWVYTSGANEWWANQLSQFHSNLSWDGIWLDMNEISSFCDGSCGSVDLPSSNGRPSLGGHENIVNPSVSRVQHEAAASSTTTSYLRTTPTPGTRNINYPPYVLHSTDGPDLGGNTLSPNATHQGGIVDYDIHNLWGRQEINATYNALVSIFSEKRPFIISRSTFVGSGKQAGHWGGDNTSLFLYMYFSIPQALSFSIFGIPMFGVDTCGFLGATTEELCNRWMQLSAFFPFYRNHDVAGQPPQEPYLWESVTEATKTAMAIRFQLLPYMYTLFANAHQTGSTVMRALAWEYPEDPTLAAADMQFFLGPAILVTPVLAEGATTVDGVFPGSGRGEIYYDWYNQTLIENVGPSQNVTIQAPLGHIPIYVRGGYVLAMQQPANTTAVARTTPWSVLVPLSSKNMANGSLYLDDGESISPPSTRTVTLTANATSLVASAVGEYKDTNPLANVTILGVAKKPSMVTFNGHNVSSSTYNATTKVFVVQNLANLTSSGAWASGWTLKWK